MFSIRRSELRIPFSWPEILKREEVGMSYRTLRMPATLHVGENAATLVGPEAKSLGATRVLLVTDKNLLAAGGVEPVLDSLRGSGIDIEIYSGVDREPTLDHVEEGLRVVKSARCDLLVGCGGGSPLDVAKAISVMAVNSGKIQDYMGLNKVPFRGLPLFAVPTTAGTGSEATLFTIITDTEHNVKMLIGSPHLMPQVAFVDPALTLKMPRGLTAATGIDALTHAIEAYVSVKAQPMTDALALSAVKLISGYLLRAWETPDDLEARSNTMLGALQAGIAFSNSSVALVHGMSRPIGALFHIPHGVSNAALLGEVMEFSLPGNMERYADIARAMGVECSPNADIETVARAGADNVKQIIAALEIPSLAQLGVTREKLDPVVEQMADDAIASGSPGNNPRQAQKAEIVDLYYASL